MKKPLLSVLCTIGMLGLLFVTQQSANANIYSQYQSVDATNWRWNPGGSSDYALPDSLVAKFVRLRDGVITASNAAGVNDFKRSFSTGGTLNDTALDNGYAKVPLGFRYNFNGVEYDSIYVSINGFATFGSFNNGAYQPPPPSIRSTDTSAALFEYNTTYPVNVLAPFWGNHKYWTTNDTLNASRGDAKYKSADMTPSSIGYVHFQIEVVDPLDPATTKWIRVCLIQWENLNVNWQTITEDGGLVDTTWNTGNLADFQLIIYEGLDDRQLQGDVQFRYNSVGHSYLHPYAPQSADWNNGAVGAKGESETGYGLADFINALYNGSGKQGIYWPKDIGLQRSSVLANRQWPPSGDVGRAILLSANPWSGGDESWGDGDADMSRIDPNRPSHFGSTDTRKFATISDVVAILRSVTTGKKLDSAYQQAAFHGDVHHDGRFYFFNGNDRAALFRASNAGSSAAVATAAIIRNNLDWTHSNGGASLTTEPEINDYMAVDPRISKDTLFISKASDQYGGYGFLDKWGKNDDYLSVDLRKAIVAAGIDVNGTYPDYRPTNSATYRIDMNNTIRTFKVVTPVSNDDYYIRIALVNPTDADRSLIWALTSDSYHREGLFSFKLKKFVWWRTDFIDEVGEGGELPFFEDNKKQLFWEANELDASFILSYLGGKITQLPWRWENVEYNDKDKQVVPYKLASNITFDNVKYNADNIVIPVYYNGVANSNQSVRFSFNGNITELKPANADVMVSYDNTNKTAVIISDGNFNPFNPVAYITVENNTASFEATDVKFYGERAENVACKLNGNVASASANVLAQNLPNPATTYTDFIVNIPTSGNYKLIITDINGNPVKVVANGTFAVGTVNFSWDITNENGDKVANGTYFYTLEGDNTFLTKSLVIAK